jgi:predicted ATPase
VVVGANGTGKSTLFEVFGFLHDCLKGNVRQALDKRGRFSEVLSRGCDSPADTILIELQYRMEITGIERLVTYSLEIGERGGAWSRRNCCVTSGAVMAALPLPQLCGG